MEVKADIVSSHGVGSNTAVDTACRPSPIASSQHLTRSMTTTTGTLLPTLTVLGNPTEKYATRSIYLRKPLLPPDSSIDYLPDDPSQNGYPPLQIAPPLLRGKRLLRRDWNPMALKIFQPCDKKVLKKFPPIPLELQVRDKASEPHLRSPNQGSEKFKKIDSDEGKAGIPPRRKKTKKNEPLLLEANPGLIHTTKQTNNLPYKLANSKIPPRLKNVCPSFYWSKNIPSPKIPNIQENSVLATCRTSLPLNHPPDSINSGPNLHLSTFEQPCYKPSNPYISKFFARPTFCGSTLFTSGFVQLTKPPAAVDEPPFWLDNYDVTYVSGGEEEEMFAGKNVERRKMENYSHSMECCEKYLTYLFPEAALGRNGRICRRNGLFHGCVTASIGEIDLTDADSPIYVAASGLMSRPAEWKRLLIPQLRCELREKRETLELREKRRVNTRSRTSNKHNLKQICSVEGASGGEGGIGEFDNRNRGTVGNFESMSNLTKTSLTSLPASTTRNQTRSLKQQPGMMSDKRAICADNLDARENGKENISHLICVKPCFLLLWRYETRGRLGLGSTQWVCVESQFVPIRGFGTACQNKYRNVLAPHKIRILDQIRAVRTRESAKLLSWCLVGCLEHTLREFGLQNFSVQEIRGDSLWAGFPDMTLDLKNAPRHTQVANITDLQFPSVDFFTAR